MSNPLIEAHKLHELHKKWTAQWEAEYEAWEKAPDNRKQRGSQAKAGTSQQASSGEAVLEKESL